MAMNVAAGQNIVIDDATLWTYIGDILYGNEDQHNDSRAAALSSLYQLLRQQETLPDLAPMLWCSSGIMTVLLSEIVKVYPKLKSAAFTANDSIRVSHSLRLMQRLVSHEDIPAGAASFPALSVLERCQTRQTLRASPNQYSECVRLFGPG